ncbi:MAG: EamA family transporter RarD [Myxococcota bacterium]|nr:EamA family transporter RarD [Myxococcota bacterium]
MVTASAASPPHRQGGLLYSLLAFVVWGLSPIYFKALKEVSPVEIAAHRVVWAIGFLVLLLAWMGRLKPVLAARPNLRRLGLYLLTTLLIGGNWLLYIWAVNTGHLLEASLGYFINPLVNVLLGVVFLRETLNRRQLIAVLLAATGVLYQVVGYGELPVISLVLATSFGVYGLLRKKAKVDPIAGLLFETSLLTPAALIYLGVLGASGGGAFITGGWKPSLLLALAGAITALPLIWFQLGANRMKLSTLGLVQYLSPTLQFLLAVLLYGEHFTFAHAVTFAFIWASLALYTADALAQGKRGQATFSGRQLAGKQGEGRKM